MRPTWAALSYLQDVMYQILGSIRRDFWGHLYNVAQINPCGRAGKSGNKRRSSTPRACSSHTWCPFSWDHPTLEAFWDLPSISSFNYPHTTDSLLTQIKLKTYIQAE